MPQRCTHAYLVAAAPHTNHKQGPCHDATPAPRAPSPPIPLLNPHPSHRPVVEYIAAFLLLTTFLVPFAFFLGMSGDYTTLPGVSAAAGTPPQSGIS